MDGRVKTIHPKIHASLLYKRSDKKHIKSFSKLNFPSINFVIVNLYPFKKTIKSRKNNIEKAIEIGLLGLLEDIFVKEIVKTKRNSIF